MDDDIISALRDGETRADVLRRIRELIDKGAPPDVLVRACLDSDTSYESINAMMISLERIASVDTDLGLRVMIGLYSVASDTCAHDVGDAIELWMYHEGTRKIKTYIDGLRSRKVYPGLERKLSEWSDFLTNRL